MKVKVGGIYGQTNGKVIKVLDIFQDQGEELATYKCLDFPRYPKRVGQVKTVKLNSLETNLYREYPQGMEAFSLFLMGRFTKGA